MIKREDLFSPRFIQNGNSCILATYAIGARYFTRKSAEEYFMAYCEHYNLPDNSDSTETRYNGHFRRYIDCMQINGYKLIKCLHDTSHIQTFLNARGLFDVEYLIDERCCDKQIQDRLKDEESCLCASCRVGGDAHSVFVAYDFGLYYIDTRTQHNGLFSFEGEWPKEKCLGDIFDGLMLSKKQWS